MALHKVKIKVTLEDARTAEIVYRSLKPEVALRVKGAMIVLEKRAKEIVLIIEGKEDLKRLTAVTNSLLNLIRLSLEIQRAVENGGITPLH